MTMTPWSSTDPAPVPGLCGALSAARVREAAAAVGGPVVRAEEPLDDEPADPADGSRDLVGVGQNVPSPSGSTSYDQTSVPAKARSG